MYCPELTVTTFRDRFLLVICTSSSLEGSPSADRNLVTDDTLCQQIEDSLVFLISSTHKVAVSFLRLLYSNIIFSNLLLQRSFADGFHAAKYWTSFFRTPDSVQYLSMLIKFVVIKHIVCMLEYCLWEI